MSITIDLNPEEERQLSERAARNGEDVGNFIRGLIAREIQSPATSLDEVLAPVRRQFEESGMTDAELATLVEEVREDIWQEERRPAEQAIVTPGAVFDCMVFVQALASGRVQRVPAMSLSEGAS